MIENSIKEEKMSDRFKFRVWDKERKCFFNDDEVVIYPNGEESFFNADYDFTECVVEQCTGLKDINGKLVYEGDILAEKFLGQIGRPGVVKYGEFNCSCCDGVYGWYIDVGDIRGLEEEYKNLVIIGNIHENADLLGEDNDR